MAMMEKWHSKNKGGSGDSSSIQAEVEEMKRLEEESKAREEAKFSDNNYWGGANLENQYNLDDLLEDMD